VLRTRRSALLGALQRYAGDAVEVADSSAGMHILAWLRHMSHTQAQALVARARARGVGVYLVAPYCHKPLKRPGLLLGYADLPPADLQAAVRILAECLSQVMAA
jgi:GntR family transcriptional regulator/MocR family aminotransferase